MVGSKSVDVHKFGLSLFEFIMSYCTKPVYVRSYSHPPSTQGMDRLSLAPRGHTHGNKNSGKMGSNKLAVHTVHGNCPSSHYPSVHSEYPQVSGYSVKNHKPPSGGQQSSHTSKPAPKSYQGRGPPPDTLQLRWSFVSSVWLKLSLLNGTFAQIQCWDLLYCFMSYHICEVYLII